MFGYVDRLIVEIVRVFEDLIYIMIHLVEVYVALVAKLKESIGFEGRQEVFEQQILYQIIIKVEQSLG
jgi:hypothetical protein